MGLEETLQVGDVEKAIGEIERAKVEKENASDTYKEELENQKRLILEKLPKILQNVNLLGSQIAGLDEQDYYYHFSFLLDGKEGVEVYKRNSRKEFGLELKLPHRYAVEFIFDRKSNSLEEIFLKKYKGFKIFSSKDKYTLKITARDINEFVEWYASATDSYYNSLPSILNLIPKIISELYQTKTDLKKRELETITKEREGLEKLNPTDLS